MPFFKGTLVLAFARLFVLCRVSRAGAGARAAIGRLGPTGDKVEHSKAGKTDRAEKRKELHCKPDFELIDIENVAKVAFVLCGEDDDGDEGEEKADSTNGDVDEPTKLYHDVLDGLQEPREDKEEVERSGDHQGEHLADARPV